MLLVIGGIKGGSGKTTLATNLTVLRASEGKKVLLVDADEQRSATDWSEQRLSLSEESQTALCQFVTISLAGKGIYAQLQKLKNDYDDIIVDTGGRDTTSQRSALTCADVLLLPFKPRSIDIWTMGKVRSMVSEIQSVNPNLKCFVVINQADPKGSDNQEAFDILAETPEITCLNTFIGNRKSFSNAAAEGLGVIEMKLKDAKAFSEINQLYNMIYQA